MTCSRIKEAFTQIIKWGAHIGTRALAGKAIKQGFYWPSINVDAKKLVRECEACQKTANQQNLPSMPVHLIPPSWPLQRWGMDLVGVKW
jgi:hypothetical protein